MNAIEVRGLRKTFRRRLRGAVRALDGLDLEVPAGGVFGFLGPNGSGKTTTIRCLLGLVRPGSGECRLLGYRTPHELSAVLGRVGSVVETPAFFGGFSGERNLDLLARAGGVPRQRVDEVIERVGLSARARDLVRTYSLGMKQRLGLASVLLKDPELLVLDEPANGLDPAGMKEIRDLLCSLGREGRTVFLSSHLLSEVELLCEAVAILARGRCIAQGPVGDVLRVQGGMAFVVRAPRIREAKAVLARAGLSATYRGDRSLRVTGTDDPGRITSTLAAAGIFLTELRSEEISLEAVFLELTGGEE